MFLSSGAGRHHYSSAYFPKLWSTLAGLCLVYHEAEYLIPSRWVWGQILFVQKQQQQKNLCFSSLFLVSGGKNMSQAMFCCGCASGFASSTTGHHPILDLLSTRRCSVTLSGLALWNPQAVSPKSNVSWCIYLSNPIYNGFCIPWS